MVLAAMLLVPSLTPEDPNQMAGGQSDSHGQRRAGRLSAGWWGNDLRTPSDDADLSLAPMQWANGRVLARWTTRVGGEPAEAYAVRLGNSLIVQYQISERVFFRNPDVRQAVARAGDFRTRDNRAGSYWVADAGIGLTGCGAIGQCATHRQVSDECFLNRPRWLFSNQSLHLTHAFAISPTTKPEPVRSDQQ